MLHETCAQAEISSAGILGHSFRTRAATMFRYFVHTRTTRQLRSIPDWPRYLSDTTSDGYLSGLAIGVYRVPTPP